MACVSEDTLQPSAVSQAKLRKQLLDPGSTPILSLPLFSSLARPWLPCDVPSVGSAQHHVGNNTTRHAAINPFPRPDIRLAVVLKYVVKPLFCHLGRTPFAFHLDHLLPGWAECVC